MLNFINNCYFLVAMVANTGEISDIIIETGVITSVKCLQIPNFQYNPNHADKLAAYGFLPTDSVYEIIVKIKGISKSHVAKITGLFEIAKYYGISSPNRLAGSKVNCTLTNQPLYDSLITKMEPAIFNETPKVTIAGLETQVKD